jgi:carbon-monoxide dehydrogenase medium subunit
MTTTIEPTELLAEIRFSPWMPQTGWAIQEVSLRAGDFAMVGVTVLLAGNGDGTCKDARIALFGVGATPVRIEQAEAALKGARLENRVLIEAARVVAEVLEPDSDIHASANYRKDVAGTLTRRALERATQRLREANEL